jgi:hypothetical protein
MSILMVLLVIAGVMAGVLTSSHPLPKSSVVDLGYARYQGVSLYNGVDEYLGMRFAKPPLEELRFRGPQDPEKTSELQDASKVGRRPVLAFGIRPDLCATEWPALSRHWRIGRG